MKKQEIIIKTKAEVITPKDFALKVAKESVTVGQTYWAAFGSIDAIKCIMISHGHDIKRGMMSVENKYQQFTIV